MSDPLSGIAERRESTDAFENLHRAIGREKTTSPNGGTRNKIGERWDLIPYSAMRLVAWVFSYGAGIHGDNNWKGSNFDGSEQDPLGRGVRHAFHAMEYPPGSIERIFQEAKAAWNLIARLWYDAKLYREKHGREPDLGECAGKTHPEALVVDGTPIDQPGRWECAFGGCGKCSKCLAGKERGLGLAGLRLYEGLLEKDEPKDVQRDSTGGSAAVPGHTGGNANGAGGLIWCHECGAYHIDGIGECDKHAAAVAASA